MKKAVTLLFVLVFGCLFCLTWPSHSVQAQSQTATQAQTPALITLQDRDYKTTTARGLLTSTEYFLPGPGPLKISSPSRFRLHYSYSDALKSNRSSFTVRVNEKDVAGALLTPGGGKDLWFDVTIPPILIEPVFNKIQVIFYMPYEDDRICVDPNDPLHWATIFSDSNLEYGAGQAVRYTGNLDLDRYPIPFYRDELGPEPPLYIVLPQGPNPNTLTAATSVVARLGQDSRGRVLRPVLLPADKLPEFGAIVIGPPQAFNWLPGVQNLPLRYDSQKGQFLNEDGSPIPLDTGVVQLIARADADPILLVSGGNEEGVRRASLTLASHSFSSLLHGRFALVTDPPKAENLDNGNIQPGLFTFGELTGNSNDWTVRGKGRQAVNLPFFIPESWKSDTKQPQVTIHFSHADRLDERSLLTVEINGTAVGSVRLNDKNLTGGSFSVSVPPSTLRGGSNTLSATFDMRPLDDRPCDAAFDEVIWGSIHRDSRIDLVFSEGVAAPDLAAFGAPFIQSGAVRQTSLVLPPSPDPMVISQTLTMAARLGERTRSDLTYVPVVIAGDNPATLPQNNLILIGPPRSFPFYQALQPILPLQYNNDGSLAWQGRLGKEKPSTPGLLAVQNQQPVGVLQIGESPWQTGKLVMIAGGTSKDAVGWAVDATSRSNLNGNVVLVTSDQRLSSLTLQPERPVTTGTAKLAPSFWIALGAGVVIVGLLLVTVVRTARKQGSNQEVTKNE